MPFPCPGCRASITRSPEAWALRCGACGGLIRSRALDSSGATTRIYEVEVAGRPETRTLVEVPWGDTDRRRLRAWLLWSSAITLGLIGVLYALARWARSSS